MGKEIRTYRECNYDIVIPFFKVGLYDFGLTMAMFTVSSFSFFILRVINEIFAQVVMFFGMGISFVFFMYARRVYVETGRTNVINEWLDYVWESEILEGRKDEEK